MLIFSSLIIWLSMLYVEIAQVPLFGINTLFHVYQPWSDSKPAQVDCPRVVVCDALQNYAAGAYDTLTPH